MADVGFHPTGRSGLLAPPRWRRCSGSFASAWLLERLAHLGVDIVMQAVVLSITLARTPWRPLWQGRSLQEARARSPSSSSCSVSPSGCVHETTRTGPAASPRHCPCCTGTSARPRYPCSGRGWRRSSSGRSSASRPRGSCVASSSSCTLSGPIQASAGSRPMSAQHAEPSPSERAVPPTVPSPPKTHASAT